MTAQSWEQIRAHLEAGGALKSGSFLFKLGDDKQTVYATCQSCDDPECYIDPEPIDEFCRGSFWHKPDAFTLVGA